MLQESLQNLLCNSICQFVYFQYIDFGYGIIVRFYEKFRHTPKPTEVGRRLGANHVFYAPCPGES